MLSRLEVQVILLRTAGVSYPRIANRLGIRYRTAKAVMRAGSEKLLAAEERQIRQILACFEENGRVGSTAAPVYDERGRAVTLRPRLVTTEDLLGAARRALDEIA